MQYFGGKFRLSKKYGPLFESVMDDGQCYVEPFCGGCNVIDKISGPRRKIANDANGYLFAMWKALQNGWEPPDSITEDQYKHIRDNKSEYPDCLVSFVGFQCAFAARWFRGYARGRSGNSADVGRRRLLRQIKSLMDVEFTNKDYRDLDVPDGSFIYCDPPYFGTAKYDAVGKFDSLAFWAWARGKADDGHMVVVSEYAAPEDFVCVMETRQQIACKRIDDGGKRHFKTERLFAHESIADRFSVESQLMAGFYG